ncbi:hypothetical protein PTSG_10436 [Salpingoeca rosetta]|uniref:Uncharacterized protein n=1 Tax=Salpingoeca rosetta (strain ATCC 50818 / BSB-021) TaxID=946362 RepID=F2UPN5_SALR5|nr:uncharacterized protein PTSG_10436 [Salpingoeca rosetta]EGD79590.1 hypothetical protein PTSG_10436 [Salpingoeca rosetta]|eukprot:XP_004988818.1 hypothetical protein PTSG_10436 [Salpingoeca rosetta]
MYSLNPNTGFVVTVNPEDPRAPDRPPLCWITTSSSLAVDDAAGNQGKFLLMSTRNSIVTVNAHVEAFCMELADGLLEFVLSKEQLDGGHHESFDYKQLLHNALQLYMEQKKKDSSRSRQDSRKKKDKGSKKGGHRSDGDSSADDVSLNAMFVLTEVSNMLVSRSFRDPVSMFLEHQQRTVDNGLKPTLENMLDELAKLTFYRPRYTEGDDDADTSLKGIAAFAIKRVQFGVIYYDVKDVMSKASPYYEWTVKCTSFDAFNRLSRLFYGVRCIVAHGRGQRTLQDTLPSAHEAFKTQDFTLVSTGTYSLPSGEGDVEKTVSMLNEVRQKAEDHVRHGKVLGLNYHDFVNFLNFARAFVELLSTVADYALDQDRAKQDMQQDEDKNPTAFQLSLS